MKRSLDLTSFHESAKLSRSRLARLAIFSASVSGGGVSKVGVIKPAVVVRTFVSLPVASMSDFKMFGTSSPSVAASMSAAVRYLVFDFDRPPGVLAPLPEPDLGSAFLLLRLALRSSSDESSYCSPRSSAWRRASCFACCVFSSTVPKPAPWGRSFTSMGLTMPSPDLPRPWPSL